MCDCTKIVETSGSIPAAIYMAALSRVFCRSSAGVLRDGHGVQIDHAVKTVIVPLYFDPLLQSAEVVADGQVA